MTIFTPASGPPPPSRPQACTPLPGSPDRLRSIDLNGGLSARSQRTPSAAQQARIDWAREGTMVATKHPHPHPPRSCGFRGISASPAASSRRVGARRRSAALLDGGEGEGMAMSSGDGEESMEMSYSQGAPRPIVALPDGGTEREVGGAQRSNLPGHEVVEVPDDSDEDFGDSEAVVSDSDDEGFWEAEGKGKRVPIHIEARMRPDARILYDTVRRLIAQYIAGGFSSLKAHSDVPDWSSVSALSDHLSALRVADSEYPSPIVPLSAASLLIHVYSTGDHDHLRTFSATAVAGFEDDAGEEDEGDGGVAASVLDLPAKSLEGVWDSLVYEGGIKAKLLNYIYSTIKLSERDVDFNIISWHRLVLLHGPPGTGKTSLCRGLAQKLAIRLSGVYNQARLVEINSHSLFSKWFSESGKLVQNLFQQVGEMVDDESCFVIVLIDEVESLTAARAGAMSGKEPSDALRVVNALLTQLDKLKTRRNVLVLTTSNLSAAIDPAFVDRADIKQYIGLPPTQAVYWILSSCINELVRAGILRPRALLDFSEVKFADQARQLALNGARTNGETAAKSMPPQNGKRLRRATAEEKTRAASIKVLELAERCHGMSGRALRRLALLAYSQSPEARWTDKPLPMMAFLDALDRAIEAEAAAIGKMDENSC